jgi:predicted Holliday junction resolvase-like endonuclease
MLKSRKGTKIYKNFIISYIITLMLPLLIMSVIVLYHFINEMKQEVEINIRNPLIKSIDNFDLYIEQLTKTSLQIEQCFKLYQKISRKRKNHTRPV